MKIKLNPIFFIMTIILPLSAGTIIIPYALFIASTPYYFSFPFGNFWQEYLTILLILDIPLIGLMSYMGVPYLVIIKDTEIILYRLRKRLTIDLNSIINMEFLYGTLPPSKYTVALNARAYLKDGDIIIISGISQQIARKIKVLLNKYGIEWIDIKDKLFSSIEQEKKFKKRGY